MSFLDLVSSLWNAATTFINLDGDGPEKIANLYRSFFWPRVSYNAYTRVQRDADRGQIALQY